MAWRSAAANPLAAGRWRKASPTTAIAARIARERGIDAPIIRATQLLLQGAITVDEAVSGLMTRPLRSEDE